MPDLTPEENLLNNIVTSIVDDTAAVKVERSTDEMGVLLMLTVAKPDMGKVVGEEGNMARSIRTILRVVGLKNNRRVNLKILEPAVT